MQRIVTCLPLCAFAVACTSEESTTAPDLLVRDVTVLDGTGAPAFVGSIVVDAGRIVEVRRDAAPDVDANEVIEGAGRFVVPGYVHLLTHVSAQSHVVADPYRHVDPIAQLGDTLRPTVENPDLEARLQSYREVLTDALASGVTTFVDSITRVEDVAALRASLDDSGYPNFHSLGPILSATGGHPPYLDGTAWKRELPVGQDFATWRAALESELESWFSEHALDGVKVAVDSSEAPVAPVPREVIEAICAVAHRHDKPCFFLSYTEAGIVDAAAAGADVKLGPPVVIGALGVQPLSEEAWSALGRVTFLSTLAIAGANLERYVRDPGLFQAQPWSRYPRLSPDTRAAYDALVTAFAGVADEPPQWTDPLSAYYHGTVIYYRPAVQAALAEAQARGLRIVPATSEGSPWVFHGTFATELHYLHADNGLGPGWEGILPGEALVRAATLDAAEVMGLEHDVGSIEPGKKADILLLDGDPIADPTALERVATVIKSGRVHAR